VKHDEEGAGSAWEAGPAVASSALPYHAEVVAQEQPGGGFWFLTTRKERPDQGRHLGEWAAQQSAAKGVRLIAVLDAETNPADFEDVMWTLLNNIDPERDVQVVGDAPGGPCWVFDATPKLPAEGFSRDWPQKITMDSEVETSVEERFAPLLAQVRGASE